MKRNSDLFTVVEYRKKNPHHPPKILPPLPHSGISLLWSYLEKTQFAICPRGQQAQTTVSQCRRWFQGWQPPGRRICKHLTFFWIKCDLHWWLLYSGKGGKVHHGRRSQGILWQSVAVSTARFLFSSLEKYVISIYICNTHILLLHFSHFCVSIIIFFKERIKKSKQTNKTPQTVRCRIQPQRGCKLK